MTSNNQKDTPSGMYVLSGFLLLQIFDILYEVFSDPVYLYPAIILVPLFIYTGLGVIRKWPGVRNMVIIMAMLFLLGTIANITGIFLMDETQNLFMVENVVRTIVGFAFLPVVFYYFRSNEASSYFEPAPKFEFYE